MSDLAWLGAIVALVYLSDCVLWVRRGSLALRATFGPRLTAALPSKFAGNPRGGFVWVNPLPPLGTVFVASGGSLAWSPEGLCTREPIEFERGIRERFVRRSAVWSELSDVRALEKELVVDGVRWLTCDTRREARRLAEFAQQLRALPQREREHVIAEELDRSLDAGALRATSVLIAERSAQLRWLCNLLFAWIALAIPLAAQRFGLERAWLALLAPLVGLQIAVCIAFARAHRALAPEEPAERRSELWMMALSPPQAVRAVDALTRSALSRFHPWAAASLLAPAQRDSIARKVLIDARFPRRVEGDRAGAQIEDWFRARLVERFEQRARADGIELERALRAPEPEDATRASWCPRCEAQFEQVRGECGDCGSALAPLECAPTFASGR